MKKMTLFSALALLAAASPNASAAWTSLTLPNTTDWGNTAMGHLEDGRFVYGHSGAILRQDAFGAGAASAYANSPSGDVAFLTAKYYGSGAWGGGPVATYTSSNLASTFTTIGNYQSFQALDYGPSGLLIAGTRGGNSDIFHLSEGNVATTLIDNLSTYSGGIAVDASGNVYVADNDNQGIYFFDAAEIAAAIEGSPLSIGDGDLVANLGVSGSLAVDSATNRLYAAGWQLDGIQVYDLATHASGSLVPGLANSNYQVMTFGTGEDAYIGWLNRSGWNGGDTVTYGYDIAAAVPLPEPATWGLLGLGGTMLALARRKSSGRSQRNSPPMSARVPEGSQIFLAPAGKSRCLCASLLAVVIGGATALAGPYSQALDDPTNAYDAPVPGFVGPDGDGVSPEVSEGNFVNPIFFGWADSVINYAPAAGVADSFSNPDLVLGPVTGDNLDIASLGDGAATPGTITLAFDRAVRNLSGADIVLYENGHGTGTSFFAELAYVEVSSDGLHFARFPALSLTAAAVGQYGALDPTDVFNLAGKHANAYGASWGTPFDFSQLANDPLVTSGTVNLAAITHVRIVDIPGTGAFTDSAGGPIYDPINTYGSGGFDLEALGAISQPTTFSQWAAARGLAQPDAAADPDGDGISNLQEYAFALLPDQADTAPTAYEFDGDCLTLRFRRDERAVDLVYKVQSSTDLKAWTTIARSEGGAPLTAANGLSPGIADTRAGEIASIGVVRDVAVTDTQAAGSRRFLRLHLEIQP